MIALLRATARASVLAMILVPTAQVDGGIIFDNFGPGDSYDTGNANDVYGPSVSASNPRACAFPFTPSATYQFASAELPLGVNVFGSGPPTIVVELLSDNGGLPGTVLESFTFTNLVKSYSDKIVQATSILHPVLQLGTQYWLAALPGAANTSGIWNYALPNTDGNKATTPDIGQTWKLNEFGEQPVSAFEIDGTPFSAVPEPSTMALMFAGLLGLLCLAHRRIAYSYPNGLLGFITLCLTTLSRTGDNELVSSFRR